MGRQLHRDSSLSPACGTAAQNAVSVFSNVTIYQGKATVNANIFVKLAFYFKWFVLGSALAIVKIPFVLVLGLLLVAVDATLRFVRMVPFEPTAAH